MKIKFKNLDEIQGGDDISNFYAENDIDLRLPDRRPKDQLEQPWATTFNPPIDRMSHDQTAHLASPAGYGASAEESLELDESLLYEKKDRCYHLAKQKYDVFPSAYASGFIVRCRQGKVGRKKKINESSKYSNDLEKMVNDDQRLRNEFAKMIKDEGGWSQELVKKFTKIHNTKVGDVFGSEGVEQKLLSIDDSLDFENFDDTDWDNYWLLSQHMDKHPDFQKKALSIIKSYKGENSPLYKQLLIRLGSNAGHIKTKEGETVNLDSIDDMGIDWQDVGLKINEGTFDKEKSQGLHGWFARKGGKGKSKGWVDCNTCRTNPKTGRKTCKTCGRQSGEERSKYPACRPTPSACTRRGTSSKRGPMRVSWKKKKKEE